MLKILHTGDIHLGDLAGPIKDGVNQRRQDTLRCMEAVYHKAFLEEPDVTIIAGDLFNRSRVWADTALDDVNDALELFVRPLCGCSGAVVLLFGTMNHDNPRAFDLLKKATTDLKNLHIYTEPTVEDVHTASGPVQIMAVPGFDKGRIRLFCPGVDKETENRNATALINDVVLGLSMQIDHSRPSVLVAHYTVSGSEADNGSTFLAGQDVVILPSTIDAAGVDLACLGHIHKPQRLMSNTPAYYCGSPNQLTFNDEGTGHGFWIHEIDQDNKGRVLTAWEPTPERKHYTLRMGAADVAAFISTGEYQPPDGIKDSIVRVRYTCTTELEKAFNRAELQKQIVAAGAFYVAEITPEDIEELDAKDQLTEHDGPAECLARWLETNEITGEKAARLLELALPIVRAADDGREDGKHTGAFVPRVIEVKNYRSYTEETFDFEPVHMAMVNGPNGVGKSSLFMDAMADCLFEQTRKEDIGGWVRDGTKSGAITFTFAMGGQEYRVIRTRTKSGRGTLALQRFDQEANTWADESDTTMKLTQAKIEGLLGMDCNTFCSIALIRQDAYGLFLDADSDRRMEVLSALLGLDIYNRMNDIARDKAREQRQKIAASKERINALREQIGQKEALLEQDTSLKNEVEDVEDDLQQDELNLKAAEAAEDLRKEIVKRADEADARAEDCKADAAIKTAHRFKLMEQLSAATMKAKGYEDAKRAAEAVEAARVQVAALAPKVDEDKELLKEQARADETATEARSRAQALQNDRKKYADILARKADVEAAQAALAALAPRKDAVQQRMTEGQKTTRALQDAKAAVAQHLADSRVRIGDLEGRLKAVQAEAAKLEDSGCPSPDKATCKFLVSAVAAQAAVPELTAALETMKADDRAKYDDLMQAYDQAKAANDAIGSPTADFLEIAQEEQELRTVADLAPQLAAAEAKIEEIDAAILEAVGVAEESDARMVSIGAERLELAAAISESAAAQETILQYKAAADRLADCQSAAATMEALAPQVETLDGEIERLRAKQEDAEREATEIRGRIPEQTGGFSRLKAAVDFSRGRLTELATRRGELKAKLEAIAEAEAQGAELRKAVFAAAATLDDYTTLAQAFSIDGIQYMIVRGVVPEIMRQSNDILAAMTGGRMAVDIRTEREQKATKQIMNSLEVWINTITGGTRPYQSHSGGEKVKIALAVTLGLADVKARRAGVQLGMLFIDEPPFLDGDGTEAYADALASMAARNPNMRILAISHDPTMKARFNQNIVVTGGEDGSKVAME